MRRNIGTRVGGAVRAGLLAWVLGACSGGGSGGGDAAGAGGLGGASPGGGGAGASGGSGAGASGGSTGSVDGGGIIQGAAYSVSPASLTFQARGGGLRPPVGTLEIAAREPLYLKAEVSGAALESAAVVITGERSARVEVRAASPNVLPVGSSPASVYLQACHDPLCGSRVQDGARTVPVTYLRAPGGVTGTPATLTFSQAFAAPAPPPQTVALHDLGDPPLPFTSRFNPESAASWLTVTPTAGALPGMVTIGVLPPARAGTYNAIVQFLSDATAGFGVSVSYTVSADFRVTPPFLNVVGAFASPTPDQRISLSDALGLSYPWTVSVSMDGSGWLTLTPSSGTSLPAEITVSLGALPDRLSRQAQLRFTGAGLERTVQLTYRTP